MTDSHPLMLSLTVRNCQTYYNPAFLLGFTSVQLIVNNKQLPPLISIRDFSEALGRILWVTFTCTREVGAEKQQTL